MVIRRTMDSVAVEDTALAALLTSVRVRREQVDASRERLAVVLEYRAEVLVRLAGVITDEAHAEQCLILAEQARSRASMLRPAPPDPVR